MTTQGAEYPGFTVECPADHPGVVLVTIDRPPANALSLAMMPALRDFFLTVGQDPKARVVVLTGAGRLFCAGADVKELSERTTESQLARSAISRAMFDAIRRCELPVVGAVNGAAIGAGLVIASSCDICIAVDSATFQLPEVNIGVMGGTRHAARVVPDKLVRYMALTGRKLTAATLAAHGGLVEVVPADQLMATAYDIADEIALKGPQVVRLMKESINLTEDLPIIEGYRIEQLYTTLASSMEEALEASSAFREKRTPRWVDELKG